MRVSYVLLVIALACLACANPADNKPEAKVAEPVGQADRDYDGAEARTLTITAESTINFVGSKVTGRHDGGFKAFEGEIVLIGNDVTQSRVSLTIDANSLWADNDRLTGHLKSPDFFDVENHPTATFNSTSIVAEGDLYSVAGDLQLHGVTKSISFPATIEVSDDEVRVEAEFVLKRFDFDIVYPGKADDLIRDEVVIKFELQAS